MKYRRLDSNWDYVFGHGVSDFLTGVDAVGQAIKSRLGLLLEEWWEDTTDGLPLWQSILGVMGASKRMIDSLIQQRILGTPNVIGIVSMQSSLDSNARSYKFYCAVNTVFGKITVASQGTISKLGGS